MKKNILKLIIGFLVFFGLSHLSFANLEPVDNVKNITYDGTSITLYFPTDHSKSATFDNDLGNVNNIECHYTNDNTRYICFVIKNDFTKLDIIGVYNNGRSYSSLNKPTPSGSYYNSTNGDICSTYTYNGKDNYVFADGNGWVDIDEGTCDNFIDTQLKDNEVYYEELVKIGGGSGYTPIETSTGCYIQEKEVISYSELFPLEDGDYSFESDGQNLIALENNLDNKTIISFSGNDELLNLTGSVFNFIDNNTVSFDTDDFIGDFVKIKIENSLGIGSVRVNIPTLLERYIIELPDGTILQNEDGTNKKISSDEIVKFGRNYDYITLLFHTDYSNVEIDKIELKRYVKTTETEEICTDLIDEAKEQYGTGFTDSFKSMPKFDTSDCTGLGNLKPTCWFAGLGNLVIEHITVEPIQKFIYGLGNLINFNIPTNYEITFSLPNGKNGLFGDFEKYTVDLSNADNPTGDTEYISDEDKSQLKINGQVIYTVQKGVWAKFFDVFIPVLFAMLYFIIILIFIFLVLLPLWLFYFIVHKLVDIIVPDVRNVRDLNKNLFSFMLFLAINAPLYAIFVYIIGEYIMFIPNLSLEVRGFFGNFAIFILDIFHFNGLVSFRDLVLYLNEGIISLIGLIVLYRLISEYGRVN